MTNKMYPYEVINILRHGEGNIHIAKLSQDIEKLQEKFISTDYKTAKNIQYEKMGLELPYVWEDIYNEAEAIRVQIRDKEQQINNLMVLMQSVEEEAVED